MPTTTTGPIIPEATPLFSAPKQRAGSFSAAPELPMSRKEMERLAKQYRELQSAYATLKAKPDDPPSNRSVGYFLFFENAGVVWL